MLNYIDLQDDLKSLTDDHVKQVAIAPATPMHGTLAVAELDRRNRMRTDYQARLANPMTTIAEQLVTGAPNNPVVQPGMATQMPGPGGVPQGGMAHPQSPIGPGMADGGSVDDVRGLAALLRQPDLETIEGAFARAHGLIGEDPASGLRSMIERYREGVPDRRRMDITQLLLNVGSGLMNSRRPDYLGALGEGAEGAVEGLRGLVERRNTEDREGIADEAALARFGSERQGRELQTGLSLYGAGREGIGNAIDVEEGIENRQVQRDVANIYASRPRGGLGGLGGMDIVSLRTMANRASIEYNTAYTQYMGALRNAASDEQDPTVVIARQAMEAARARRDELNVALSEALAGGGLNSLGGATGPGLGALGADPTQGAAPSTNAPHIREGETFYDGVNRSITGAQVVARVLEMARRNGWDAARTQLAIQSALASLSDDGSIAPGSYEEYSRGQQEEFSRDLGDYSVRTE